MTNSIFYNPFDEWLIEELRMRYSIEAQDVQAVIWFPVAPYDKYTCAIRFCKRITIEDFSTNDLVENLSCVGNYLNLILNNEKLVNKVIDVIGVTGKRYGFTLKCADLRIAIEHTSLTPVYPINISTFRSSIIGNALTHYYKKFGAEVNIHYLVADTARNIELVLGSSAELGEQNYSGKADHICGALFCYALEKIGKFSNAEHISKMFPKFRINEQCKATPHFYDVQSYCKFCLDGHIKTLSDAGIYIDTFDYESEVIKNSGTECVSYLANNAAYYSFLASRYDSAYSVISSRQKEIISESLQTLDENSIAKVVPIYFNDTVCKVEDSLEGENELAPDSIRSTVFHAVDSYIEAVCLKFNVTMEKAYNALKLMVLSHNPSSIIVIDYNNYEDIASFIHLLDKIESLNKKSVGNSDITLADVELSKNLILAYQVFNMNSKQLIMGTKELATANIVKYIKSLTDIACADMQNEGLIKCTLQTVRNAMDLLGLVA